MTEFRFTNEHTSAGIADIADVLRKPRLLIPTKKDYPTHETWVDRTEASIATDKKRAMAAYMGQDAIGVVIYRQSAEDPEVLDIRNMSVIEDARGRGVGAFALETTEREAALNDFPGIKRYVIDTKISNPEMIGFLKSRGYSIERITDLYGQGTGLDVVMSKPVKA